jgi:hypothetical protein
VQIVAKAEAQTAAYESQLAELKASEPRRNRYRAESIELRELSEQQRRDNHFGIAIEKAMHRRSKGG